MRVTMSTSGRQNTDQNEATDETYNSGLRDKMPGRQRD